MAVGWKKGVPGGKPNAVGPNGIYTEQTKMIHSSWNRIQYHWTRISFLSKFDRINMHKRKFSYVCQIEKDWIISYSSSSCIRLKWTFDRFWKKRKKKEKKSRIKIITSSDCDWWVCWSGKINWGWLGSIIIIDGAVVLAAELYSAS